MKKISVILALCTSAVLFSCQKETSLEGDTNNNSLIIGIDCLTSKIVYADSASDVARGSIAATIDAADRAILITRFDSLSFTINFNVVPQYAGDTVYINSNEYFILDPSTSLVKKFHGLYDPTNVNAPKFNIDYSYNTAGNLLKKSYSFDAAPTVPYEEVNYTYSGGNLVQMVETDLTTGGKITDAEISYNTVLTPKNNLYIFPDEYDYAEYTQFYNFGKRPTNAVKSMKVRFYAPGNVVSDSAVSTFSGYEMSADNYLLKMVMSGDDQYSIPAPAGRLKFSYQCN